MRQELTTVDPGVQQAFDKLLLRHPDVEAILLSTADGIPLMRALRPSPSSPAPSSSTSALETRIAAIFSIAADQARKLGHGSCKSIVSLYQGLTLVHINLTPLVLSFVGYAATATAAEQQQQENDLASSTSSLTGGGGEGGREGGREGGLGSALPLQLMNVGMILDSQHVYEEALAPLRAAVEASEREAARGRML